MPYIKKEERTKFENILNKFQALLIQENLPTGDMNYLFTSMCHLYIKEYGLKYENINNIIGILECVKTELNRRVVGPYENKKIQENGDI